MYAARDSSSIEMRPGPIMLAPELFSGVWLFVYAWYYASELTTAALALG